MNNHKEQTDKHKQASDNICISRIKTKEAARHNKRNMPWRAV